jgi:hypothetical protein
LGLDQAARCPEFHRVNTKESRKEAFIAFLKTSDVATIAVQYPDIAALLWVLDVEGPVVVSDMEAEAKESSVDQPEPDDQTYEE